MATKYNDIVTLRQMRPAYNIKEEAPDDWKTFIANDLFNSLLRKTVAAVRNNVQYGLLVHTAQGKVMLVPF